MTASTQRQGHTTSRRQPDKIFTPARTSHQGHPRLNESFKTFAPRRAQLVGGGPTVVVVGVVDVLTDVTVCPHVGFGGGVGVVVVAPVVVVGVVLGGGVVVVVTLVTVVVTTFV